MQVFAALFVILIGFGVLAIIVMFFIDITQTKSAIRRNYPVVGRFRYFFEHIGEFFRQYFFAMDREELPFNRAQRSWAYRAAKNIDNTVGFGSTRDLRPTGTVLFVNCPFPTLGVDAAVPGNITIRTKLSHPLYHLITIQYFRHELRRHLETCRTCTVTGCKSCRLLDEHR